METRKKRHTWKNHQVSPTISASHSIGGCGSVGADVVCEIDHPEYAQRVHDIFENYSGDDEEKA